jgi:dimethylamine monooxygenase subunit A
MTAPSQPTPYDHPEAHLFRIGLAPIDEAAWFEGPYLAADGDPAVRKSAAYAASPALCWGETEGSRAGQAEAMEMMERHFGRPAAPRDFTAPPLRRAASLVDDDLCLMERRAGGWTLTAASLCAPSFFSAAEAVGKSLAQLHGPVTGFGERLLPRVARIFDALAEGSIVERRNWSVVASGELFLPDSTPVRARQPLIAPEDAGRELYLRMERQTLRRLPATGGLLFTIRIWRHPLEDLRAEPERLAAFAAAWDRVMRDDGQTFRDYKGLGPLDGLVLAFLAGA